MAIISGPPTISVSAASFTGPAFALEYVGNHAYSYGGIIGVTDSETTIAQFSTGNNYVVGTVQITYLELGSEDATYLIYINEQVVMGYRAIETAGVSEPDNTVPIIVPAYSTCKITATMASAVNRDHIAAFIGRVYRG